jgi:hypothetical protein
MPEKSRLFERSTALLLGMVRASFGDGFQSRHRLTFEVLVRPNGLNGRRNRRLATGRRLRVRSERTMNSRPD